MVNLKYLQPDSRLPPMEPDSEIEIPYHSTMKELIQAGEHSGCASGRCRAILLVCENNIIAVAA